MFNLTLLEIPMNIYITSAVTLILLVVLVSVFDKRKTSRKSPEKVNDTQTDENSHDSSSSACCGKHTVCEKDRLTEAMMNKANYFEDEGLDRYKGRSSSDYVDSEIEEFRYVLYTMEQNEVSEWLESLQVRGIELPNALKEEAFSLMKETD